MLYLLKGSRVAEYRRENIDILSRGERAAFSITYSRRWIEDGLTVAPGDGGVIVFADSPYKRFAPVRFCVLEEVEDEPHKMTVHGHLGPFVEAGGIELLTERWAERTGDDRPGLKFLFTDDNPGLHSPNSPTGHDAAWRGVVDALGSNPYFAKMTAARAVGIRDHTGLARDLGEPVDVGEELTIDVELRTPANAIDEAEPTLDVDPRGSAELVDPKPVPATGPSSIRVRPLTAGALMLRISLKPEPLHSCRLPINLVAVQPTSVRPTPPAAQTSAERSADVDVRALINHLQRDAQLRPEAWVRLHEDVLLRARPEDPDLLGDYAQHCFDAADFDKTHIALARLKERTPEQNTLLLLASLRSGREADLESLLSTSDFSGDHAFGGFLEALDATTPATIHRVLKLLLSDLVADEKLMTAATKVWSRVSSVEVACQVAEKIAYLDPELGARLLLDKWPDPTMAPDHAIDLLLDWGVQQRRLGPYAEARVERAADQVDWDTVLVLVERVRALPGGHLQPRALATAGRYLLTAGGEPANRGLEVLCDAIGTAALLGEIDLARSNLGVLKAASAREGTAAETAALTEISAMVDAAVLDSEALQRWEAMQQETAYDALRPRYEGKVVHAVGGLEPDWCGEVAGGLGLAKLKWHETEKKGSSNTDWVKGVDLTATVVIMTDFMSHTIAESVRGKCDKRGIEWRYGTASVRGLLEALGS